MTVLIYVNTSEQVGDPEHLKVFANADAAEIWFEENDPKASLSNMSLSNMRSRWRLVGARFSHIRLSRLVDLCLPASFCR
jgi:hypothetical protein